MEEWDAALRDLADDPSEYERQGGTVLLMRHGEELELSMKDVPGVGLAVQTREDTGATSFVPVGTYVQREILGLPRLARQIARTLTKSWEKRPGRFIEGPAELIIGSTTTRWDDAAKELRQSLAQAEPGTTTLVQLMAAAGQGKTALLEHMALQGAQGYRPESHPEPLLLPVDLLGRYVGTVDDAIAGSLNNTYVFPELSQRDVALCLRRRWLLLALDGFDELVARVGVRDAFNRVTELLDQLQGSGTIILSARESFFELYEISSAIRSYLQPKRGAYTTVILRLLPWGRRQGREIFQVLGSANPDHDLDGLFRTFESDETIVFHPFFLTRLADLWTKGERFTLAGGQPDQLHRIEYVISTFIERESGEKWVDRDGQRVLPIEGHLAMLGAIAEEMWNAGAFRLSLEELQIASEIGLSTLALRRDQVEGALSRVPTHAALLSKGRGYSFLHDQFFHYFLGRRLADLLDRKDRGSVLRVLGAREFSPMVVTWVVRGRSRTVGDLADTVRWLDTLVADGADGPTSANVSKICAALMAGQSLGDRVRMTRQTFVGDVLKRGTFTRIDFEGCKFWHVDLSDTTFAECTFRDCEFGDIRVSKATRFQQTVVVASTFSSIDIEGEHTVYVPEEVAAELQRRGVAFPDQRPVPERKLPQVRDDVARCVGRFVRQSEKTCDVAIEDIEELCGRTAVEVAKVGRDSGVLKDVVKAVSGPRRQFVRFQVDRDRLLRGQVDRTGIPAIDGFWDELRRRFRR